jgi:hypothetical protein
MTQNFTQPSPRRFFAWLLPRLDDVVFMALFLLVILFGPRLLNVDGDLGRHLTLGEYILQTTSIPTADVLSHTMPGQPFTPHEWLSEVIFALAYRLLGLDGVVLFCAILIALTFTLVFRIAVRRSGLRLASLALTLLAASASSLHWLARPHLFTLLLVILWTDGLESMARGEPRPWWRQPLLMLVWANLHGAFIIGFTVWLAYLAEAALAPFFSKRGGPRDAPVRGLLLSGVLSLGATVLNPAGPAIWATSLGFLGNAYLVGHTAEYLPPDFHNVGTWPFLLLIVLALALLGPGPLRIRPRSLLVLAGWIGLGLVSMRHIPVAAVLAVPILAQAAAAACADTALGASWLRREAGLHAFETRLRGRLWPPTSVLLVAALLAAGVRMTPYSGGNLFSPQVFPVQAMDWVEAHPPSGPVFNYFTWGGYLLHRAWPDVTVFMDAQTDFYGEALTREYEQVITLDGAWQQILEKYNVSWVIMPANSRLVRRLESMPGWTEVYLDGTAAVLERAP